MLEWKVCNGDDKLRNEIKRVKDTFDSWYESTYWSRQGVSKERLLSEDSPVRHVYYKMRKSFEEVKKEYPYDALQQCKGCEEYVDTWIETSFSFCHEYSCEMSLCKKCADKIKNEFEDFTK